MEPINKEALLPKKNNSPVSREEFEALQRSLEASNKALVQVIDAVNNGIPGIDAAAMLALYTLSKSSIEVKVPETWDSKDYMPIQKLITNMHKAMEETAKANYEKMEQMKKDGSGKS